MFQKCIEKIINWLDAILIKLNKNKKETGQPKPNIDKHHFEYTSPNELQFKFEPPEIPLIKTHKIINSESPTILFMDDFPGVISVLYDDLDFLDKNIKEVCNIIHSDTPMAAFSIKTFLENLKGSKIDPNINPEAVLVIENDIASQPIISAKINKIDLAILDISINGFNLIDDVMTELDGIDIAKLIKDQFPECKIYFITGHTPSKKNAKIFKYMEKFEKYFGYSIEPYIIPKTFSHVAFFKEDLRNILINHGYDLNKNNEYDTFLKVQEKIINNEINHNENNIDPIKKTNESIDNIGCDGSCCHTNVCSNE